MSQAITPIPTQAEIETARQASRQAWIDYVLRYNAGEDLEDCWADYMAAIERANQLQFKHDQATLKEAGICSLS